MTEEWTNKMCYTHTMGNRAALKKEERKSCHIWKNLEDIILNKISQSVMDNSVVMDGWREYKGTKWKTYIKIK